LIREPSLSIRFICCGAATEGSPRAAQEQPRAAQGRPEGSWIEDYVVEDHADHVFATLKTQQGAIDWFSKNDHAPLVAGVRHLNDKKKPDHWRAA